MEHQMIAALVIVEQRVEHQIAAGDPHDQRRLDALRERDRAFAARSRAEWWTRMRAMLARGLRRVAEAVEPPRPVCISSALDPC